MHLDLSEAETFPLLNLLTKMIENDRYPLSPLIQILRGILAKFGPMAPAPPPPAGHPLRRSATRTEDLALSRDGIGDRPPR